jgi:ubiquinone/menaquinone biosynthesis C-methylase UbiE
MKNLNPDDKYSSILDQQFANASSGAINVYLRDLTAEIDFRINSSDKILEIGAGAGTSSIFLKSKRITMTDLLVTGNKSVFSGVDAHNLPFPEHDFNSSFAIDALHHLANPFLCISEMLRVVKPGGKVIFIEPYVSIFSYPIYKLFHPELTTLRLHKEYFLRNQKAASEGNQVVCQTIFRHKSFRHEIIKAMDQGSKVEIYYRDILAFFLTGGITNPLPTSPRILKLVLGLEKRFPQIAFKLLGSRMVVVITKPGSANNE